MRISDHGGSYGGGKYRKNSEISEDALLLSKSGGEVLSFYNTLSNYTVAATAVSGDGKVIAAINSRTGSGFDITDAIYIYNGSGDLIRSFRERTSDTMATMLMLNHDGSKLWVFKNGLMIIYDVLTGTRLTFYSPPGPEGTPNSRPNNMLMAKDGSGYYLLYPKDLGNTVGIRKFNQSNEELWNIGNPLYLSYCIVENEQNGDIIIGSQGSGGTSYPSLLCYTKDKVLKWSVPQSAQLTHVRWVSINYAKNEVYAGCHIAANLAVSVYDLNTGVLKRRPSNPSGSTIQVFTENPFRFDELGNSFFVWDSARRADVSRYSLSGSLLWSMPTVTTSTTTGEYMKLFKLDKEQIVAIVNSTARMYRIRKSNVYKILD